MKRLFLISKFILVGATATLAQSVGINTTGNQPHASSILDISSTSRGLLIPRMTIAQRVAIAAPATGLQVYQTDGITGFYYYNGNTWTQLGAASANLTGWSTTGNSAINPGFNFLGTLDATNLNLATNNANRIVITGAGNTGIGYGSPEAILDVRRGTNNTEQPVFKLEDYTKSTTFPSMSLYASGNHPLIAGGTDGDGILLNLERINAAGKQDAVNIINTGDGDAIHAKMSSGHGNAITAIADMGLAGYFYSNGPGLQVHGSSGADITATNGNGIELTVTGSSYGAQLAYGINVDMTATGTGTVYGISSTPKSITAGQHVIGVYSHPEITGNGKSTAFLGIGNEIITGATYFSSDRKLKQNIKPMPNMLDKIMQLKPATYQYKTTEYPMNLPGGDQFGLIAQELQTVFPELVAQQQLPATIDAKSKAVTAAGIEYLGVNYNGLIPIIISGVQEQETKIKSLEAENLQLKKDIAAIKAKLGL